MAYASYKRKVGIFLHLDMFFKAAVIQIMGFLALDLYNIDAGISFSHGIM